MGLKKKLMVIIFFTTIFFTIALTISFLSKNTQASLLKNKILVTGRITDEANNAIKNAKIKITNGTKTYQVKTNAQGEYLLTVDEGSYKIYIDYSECGNNYTNIVAQKRKYSVYNENLEIAFVYKSTEENKNLLNNLKDIKVTQKDFRVIDNKYINDTEIQSNINILQCNSAEPRAFHYQGIWAGEESILVAITNKTEGEIKSYIDEADLELYKNIICNQNSFISNIINEIYTKLEITGQDENIDFANNINIDSTSIIHIKAKKENTSSGDLPLDSAYPDFITGNIKISNTNIDAETKVILRKKENNHTSEYKTTNGYYKFAYPGSGTFQIEYEFIDKTKINSQDYQPDDSKYKSITANRNTDNCLKTSNTNLGEMINYYKVGIDYNKEKDLDNYVEVELSGISDSFTIPNRSDTWDPNENKIEAGVILKQREKFSLTVTEEINSYKIILNNGQVFQQYKYDPNSLSRQMKLFNVILSDKLSYGAKLYVEYKITLKNSSSIDCQEYTLLKRLENLDFDEEQQPLSDSAEKNSFYNWKKINQNRVRTILNDRKDTTDTLTFVEKSGKIKGGKDEIIYITLTRPLEVDGCTFDSSCEIVKYTNNEGRRNFDTNGNIIKAGNYIEDKSIKEEDFSTAETIAILPPTGHNVVYIIMILIFSAICIQIIKRRILNGKNKK